MHSQKVLYLLKKVFTLLALLSLGMACQLVAPADDSVETVTLDSCYQVTFLGFTENTEQVSTWSYRVEEQSCAQDLSNWMLELPACTGVIDATPAPWKVLRPDPNYQFDGIKWETGTDFQSGEFSVVLSGDLMVGTVHVGVKGPDVAIGEIDGPACTLTADTPIVTLTSEIITPSLTVTVDVTTSPTAATPTLQPPPASSGTILITDNDQVLTFTCNGNAVEVRGNANMITLMGSCSSIAVSGNANQVYWQAGNPIITNTGNENIILHR